MSFSAPRGANQISTMSPQQQQLFSSLIGKLGGGAGQGVDYLSRLAGGDQSMFSEMEAPAYSAFNKQLGNIGSRFADVGAIGSSGFQNATSGAAAQLGESLASKRGELQRGAIERLLGLSSELLGKQTFGFEDKDQGFDWGSLIGTLGGAAGSAFLGPIGGAVGKGAGDWLSRLFEKKSTAPTGGLQ